MDEVRVGLLGCGTVGTGVVTLLWKIRMTFEQGSVFQSG